MIRILIVGPDGTGKTATAQALAHELGSRGFKVRARHGAPSVRRPARGQPVEHPHLQRPRSLVVSILKLVAAFARYAAEASSLSRGSTQVDISERGWDDQLVDPVRYRLHGSSVRFVRWLGWLLPRTDVCVLLAGDATLIHARKRELPVTEIDRQITAWRRVAPRRSRSTREMDCIRETPELIATATADLTVGRFGERDRWRAVWPNPSRVDLRVVAGHGAMAASSIYQPMRPRARGANYVARAAFRTGLRVRTSAPVPGIRSILASCGLGGLAVATMKSYKDGRFVAGVADDERLVAVLKIGRGDDSGLANEVHFLEILEPTGMVPRLRTTGHQDGRVFIATDAVPRAALSRVVSVEEAMNLATTLQGEGGSEPIVHGDLTPWNIIPSNDRLVLIDWEHAIVGARPLYDLAHFIVCCGALLGRWSPEAAAALLTADGSPGARHLAALGIGVDQAPAFVRAYLSSARAMSDARVGRFRAELAGLFT